MKRISTLANINSITKMENYQQLGNMKMERKKANGKNMVIMDT